MRHTLADSVRGDDRAVSEVAAAVLLLGIVFIAIATIVLIGGAELTSSQETAEINQAEQALTQFDSDASRVVLGSTTSQRTDLGLRGNSGTLETQPEQGNISIVYVDNFENGNRTPVASGSLGTVVYENGETTVGYQGGGVWRSDRRGSMLISSPEMSFQNGTLTMHVVRLDDGDPSGSVHSEVQVARTDPSTEHYPNASRALQNRVRGAVIEVTVESRYYRAWGQFFAAEANTIVQYDHDNQRVTIQFVALPVDYSADAGVVATSGPGEIRLEGNGAYIDSYNSSEAPYDVSNNTEGSVQASGEIITKGDAQIDGETHAGRNISVEGGSTINGDAYANGTIEVDGNSNITGSQYENNDTVPEIPPINQLVERRTESLSDPENNDNNETDLIENNELQIDDEGELESGKYYLEAIDLQGETLVLNTSDGDITLAVRDWVVLEKAQGDNSHIVVEGEGEVRLYVASEQKTDVSVPGAGQAPVDLDRVHFFVERNGTVDVPGDKSHRFMVFAPDHFTGAVGGSSSENADVTATFIAPAGPLGSGQFYVQQGEVYGAIMTGNLTLGQYGQVHFDRALLDEKIPLAPAVPRLEYLYVTEHEVEVESAS